MAKKQKKDLTDQASATQIEKSPGGGYKRPRSLFPLLFVCLISLTSVGFAAWQMPDSANANDSVSKVAGSENIGVADNETATTTDQDYVDIEIDKSIKLADPGSASSGTDYLYADFKWTQKDGSTYSSDLNEYFYLWDSNDPISDASPHLEGGLNGEGITFENHFNYESGIKSKAYWQPGYDIVDTSVSRSDSSFISECKAYMEKLPWMGYNSDEFYTEYAEVTYGSSPASLPSYVAMFYSRQTNGSVTKNYRLHMFYKSYQESGSSSVLACIDSSQSNTASYLTGTTTTGTDATVTIALYDSSSSNTTLNIDGSKLTRPELRISGTIDCDGSTVVTISRTSYYLNANQVNSADAGYDPRYQTIDFDKTSADFDDTTCRNFVSNYLATLQVSTNSVWRTTNNYTIEIVSEDDENANLYHNPKCDPDNDTAYPYFKVYAARQVRSSGTKTGYYRYFIFYYIKGDSKLRVLHDQSDRFTSAADYETEWPTFWLYPTSDGWTGVNGNTSNCPSYVLTRPTSRKYLRWNAERVVNGTSSWIGTTGATKYFEAPYNETMYTGATKDDFDGDFLKKYTKQSRAVSGCEVEVLTEEETDKIVNPYSFIYAVMSRVKIGSGTYAGRYYQVYLTLYYYLDSNPDLQAAVFTSYGGFNNTTSSLETDEWPSYTIHSDDAETYPTTLGCENLNYHQTDRYDYTYPYFGSTSCFVGITFSYKKTDSGSATTQSRYWELLGTDGGTFMVDDYVGDSADTENLPALKHERYVAAYNRFSDRRLYGGIDESKEYNFYGYFDSSNSYAWKDYYFYYREDTQALSNGSSYRNYNTTYSQSYRGHWNGGSTALTPDRLEGYTYSGYHLGKWNRYQQQYVSHDFVDSSGDVESFCYGVAGTYSRNYLSQYLSAFGSGLTGLYTYKIRLIPRNDEIKADMHNILADFTFSLDIGIETLGEFDRE